MLTVQINRALEVNGFLFDVLADAARQPGIDAAELHLRRQLKDSRIYRVVHENDEVVQVRSYFHRHPVAYLGA